MNKLIRDVLGALHELSEGPLRVSMEHVLRRYDAAANAEPAPLSSVPEMPGESTAKGERERYEADPAAAEKHNPVCEVFNGLAETVACGHPTIVACSPALESRVAAAREAGRRERDAEVAELRSEVERLEDDGMGLAQDQVEDLNELLFGDRKANVFFHDVHSAVVKLKQAETDLARVTAERDEVREEAMARLADAEHMESERDEARARMNERIPKQLEKLPVREAARRRLALTGPDAQALEGALAQVERELEEARNELAEILRVIDGDKGGNAVVGVREMMDDLADTCRERDDALNHLAAARSALAEANSTLAHFSLRPGERCAGTHSTREALKAALRYAVDLNPTTDFASPESVYQGLQSMLASVVETYRDFAKEALHAVEKDEATLAEAQAENKLLRDAYATAIDKTDDALASARAAGRRQGIEAAHKIADDQYCDAAADDNYGGRKVAGQIRATLRSLLSDPWASPAGEGRDCTCLGTCKGPEGLGPGWRCALGKVAVPETPPQADAVPETPPQAGWIKQAQDDAAEVATWPEYKQGRYAQVAQDAEQGTEEAHKRHLAFITVENTAKDIADEAPFAEALAWRSVAAWARAQRDGTPMISESEVARRIAQAVAEEREGIVDLISQKRQQWASDYMSARDTGSANFRDAADRILDAIRARAKKGESRAET